MRYHIDTHVHVYHCYEPGDFLSQAVRNSDAADPDANLVLCLTESSGFDFFNKLKITISQVNSPIQPAVAGWALSEIPGQPAILLSKADRNIIIIAGRQVITKQGLEVLALFDEQQYSDGEEIQTVIKKINANKGLAALPWGVGKWLGKRGTVIEELLNTNKPGTLVIADISSRPALWPAPPLFRLAKDRGYSCLYGSDPLPLHYDQLRIGSAGIIADLPSDPSQAVSGLKSILITQGSDKTFGKRVSSLRFIKDQIMLRINKQSCISEL